MLSLVDTLLLHSRGRIFIRVVFINLYVGYELCNFDLIKARKKEEKKLPLFIASTVNWVFLFFFLNNNC